MLYRDGRMLKLLVLPEFERRAEPIWLVEHDVVLYLTVIDHTKNQKQAKEVNIQGTRERLD